MGEAGAVGDEQDRSGPVFVGRDGPAGGGLGFDLGADLLEAVLGVGQEDAAEDGAPVLVEGEGRVGSQLVGRGLDEYASRKRSSSASSSPIDDLTGAHAADRLLSDGSLAKSIVAVGAHSRATHFLP